VASWALLRLDPPPHAVARAPGGRRVRGVGHLRGGEDERGAALSS
jgi:hypothetical protein